MLITAGNNIRSTYRAIEISKPGVFTDVENCCKTLVRICGTYRCHFIHEWVNQFPDDALIFAPSLPGLPFARPANSVCARVLESLIPHAD